MGDVDFLFFVILALYICLCYLILMMKEDLEKKIEEVLNESGHG